MNVTSLRISLPGRQVGQDRLEGNEDASSLPGWLARFSLAVVVCSAPWLLGGVQARVQTWIFLGVLLSLVAAWMHLARSRSSEPRLPIALLPLLLAMALGLLQQVPLPDGLHRMAAPATAGLWHELAASSPAQMSRDSAENAGAPASGNSEITSQALASETLLARQLGMPADPEFHTVSLYPGSTRRDLGVLAVATTVFLVGGLVFASASGHGWLLWLVAANGAALACFGIVQQLTWNGQLYWRIPLLLGGTPFASYVNRNNAAGFLNLGLAAALGLVVLCLARNAAMAVRYRAASWGQQVLVSLATLNARTLVAVGLAGCLVAGVLCSLSRGAWLAMAAAAIVTTVAVALTWRFRGRLSWIVLVLLVGLGLVGWVGRSTPVQSRLATLLHHAKQAPDRRLGHWQTGLRTAREFWSLGSGLGTYRHIYRLYQTTPEDAWYYHAENQYLEALVETGIVGLCLMLAAIGLLGVASWPLLQAEAASADYAWGVAGVFALTSQAIHAFFDFGLYLPANMLLFALLSGIVAGRAASRVAGERGVPLRPALLRLPRVPHLAAGLAGLLVCAVAWSCLETRKAAAHEQAMEQVPPQPDLPSVSPEALREALGALAAVAEDCPADAVAQQRMARLWMALYRTEKLKELRGDSRSPTAEARLWPMTSPTYLHGKAHGFAGQNRVVDLASVRNDPLACSHLRTALRYLLRARRACPLLADVHLHLAELCVLAVDPAEDWVHLERTRRAAPSAPETLYYVGLLELQAGRPELACVSWRKCLELSPAHLSSILAYADRFMNLAQRADALLPDLPAVLVRVARENFRDSKQAETRRAVLRKAEALIAKMKLSEAELCFLQGSVWAAKDQPLQALPLLAKAVELRPQEVGWRYDLAVLMNQRGLVDQAREHAKTCVRLEPGEPKYETLLRQLIRTQLTESGTPPAETRER